MLHFRHILTLIVFTSALCAGCDSTPKIHYAKQLENDLGGYYVNYPEDSTWMSHSKREVFIIEHPPSDRRALMRLILENEEYLPIEKDQISWTCDEFYRYYYKESWATPLDLVEYSSGLSVEDLSTHTEDLICKVTMAKYWKGNVPDSLRCRWSCNCTVTGDTLIEYRSAVP